MTVAQSKSIIGKLWDEIDTVVAQVVPLTPKIKAATALSAETSMAEPDDPVHLSRKLEVMTLTAEKNKLGGIGRGLAIALHMMTQPHFAEVGDVVKHAQARYKAAQSGETIATPGMSDESWPPEPAPKASSPADPEPQAPATAPSSQTSPAFSSGPAVESPLSGTATPEAEPKKAARGATKTTTADPSSAAVSGATSSTTGTSPASPAKAPAPKATPAPTPDEIIAQDAARGRGVGVEGAVAASAAKASAAREAQDELEDKANGKLAEIGNTGDDESPKSIAAMLEDLENM